MKYGEMRVVDSDTEVSDSDRLESFALYASKFYDISSVSGGFMREFCELVSNRTQDNLSP